MLVKNNCVSIYLHLRVLRYFINRYLRTLWPHKKTFTHSWVTILVSTLEIIFILSQMPMTKMIFLAFCEAWSGDLNNRLWYPSTCQSYPSTHDLAYSRKLAITKFPYRLMGFDCNNLIQSNNHVIHYQFAYQYIDHV